MSRPVGAPERWRDRPAGGGAVEDRMGALLDDLPAPPAPGGAHLAAQLALMERVLRARVEREAAPGRRARTSRAQALAVAAVVVAILCASAAVLAARGGWDWRAPLVRWLGGRAAPPATPAPSRALSPQPRGSRSAAAVALALPPPPAPEPAAEPAAPPARAATVETIAPVPPLVRRRRHAAVIPSTEAIGETPAAGTPAVGTLEPAAPPPVPAPTSTLLEESRLLGRALAALRQRHDAAGALAALDEHDARFPRGTGALGREADLARADALLSLGRGEAALRLLGGMALGDRGREGELLLVRAELRSAADCRRAAIDFGRVLGAPSAAPWRERALFGRGACRARLGDGRGATADLRAYLDEFPAGRFAAAARRLLERP